MYRKPPEDDEQSEDILVSYPRRRSRRAIPNRSTIHKYHPDETPAIPRVRRASLVDQQPTPPNHARNGRQRLSHKDDSQSRSYNRRPLIVRTLLIVMLILTPIVITVTLFNIHRSPTSATLYRSTPVTTTPVLINQAPANPHEIVILPQDTDHPPPPVFAQSAYLLDADTGVTLYAYNPFKHIPPMSTTKLMTAVIALEIGDPAQKITITDAIDHDINQLSPDSSLFGVKK